MGMPDSKSIKKTLKKLEKAEGTLMISPDATPLERLRWDLCQKFIVYKRKNKLNQKQLSEKLGVDEAKMSKILRHRIEEFSTDRLMNLYQQLDPEIKIRVG